MIPEWITQIIDGPAGLHSFEEHEIATPTIPRDEAVAAWVIRCLANPLCEGSEEVFQAIAARREKVKART